MKRMNAVSSFILLFLVSIQVTAQNARITPVTETISLLTDGQGRETRALVQSGKGLVVFDSFWAKAPANRFRDAVEQTIGRNDFVYVLNMTDRLDMFGGNAAYPGARVIGQEMLGSKYKGKEEEVRAEIRELIDMWRWKEDVSRKRLPTHEQGSDAAINEERWANICKQRADELESGYSLRLPDISYSDRMTLYLGDITLELIWFGKAGNYNGMSVAVIPEEKTAFVPGFILHSQHLAPHPFDEYKPLDIDRWISVLAEILEGDDAVNTVICGMGEVWNAERAVEHLHYIRTLWKRVQELDAAGKSLAAIQDQLSLEKEFAFVKRMQAYVEGGDDWIRPQHRAHVSTFYQQLKTFIAADILMQGGADALQASLARVRELRADGEDIHFDEAAIARIGDYLLKQGAVPEAIAVLTLNAEVFPESAAVYAGLGEAYTRAGEATKAVEQYRKSLERNPENKNVIDALNELERTIK
ncbi:hypothetical protein JXO52_06530 [bacterium]|nr:hypothetical protein [bacterium]